MSVVLERDGLVNAKVAAERLGIGVSQHLAASGKMKPALRNILGDLLNSSAEARADWTTTDRAETGAVPPKR
jgi:hypothetical protein